MRILLIESDLQLCGVLAFKMESKGLIVDICKDAEEGLYYILQDIHDVILLDNTLLTKNVIQLLQGVRQEKVQIPIIFFTSPGTPTEQLKELMFDMDDYIVKPFQERELFSKIQSVVMRSVMIADTQLVAYGE